METTKTLNPTEKRQAVLYAAKHGFANKEILYNYIKHVLGYHIPRKTVCAHHDSPFDFLADCFFGKVETGILFASRSSGKTTLMSILNHLDSNFKGVALEIASAGAILNQAVRHYTYFLAHHMKEATEGLLLSSIMSKSLLWTGSTVSTITGTIAGFNCLAGETLIHTTRYGEKITIRELSEMKGLFNVQGFDLLKNEIITTESNGAWLTSKNALLVKVVFDGGSFIECTSHHPFLLANRTYKVAGLLIPGDTVLPSMKVVSKIEQNHYGDVYDLSVPETHNFIANGVVVGNSPHPNSTVIDEIELMKYDVLQEGLQMSISKDGIPARDLLTSTRKFASGTMQRVLNEAPDNNTTVRSYCIWDVLEKCTRQCKEDPTYGDCEIYTRKRPFTSENEMEEIPFCNGKAHNADGWYKIRDFIKKTGNLADQTVDTQWLNEKPGHGFRIYESFTPTPPYVIKPFKIALNSPVVSCIDPKKHFTYIKAVRKPNRGWIIFYEYVSLQYRTLDYHIERIRKSPLYRPKELIWFDPSDPQLIMDCRARGLNIMPADNNVSGGIDQVNLMFQKFGDDGAPMLQMFETCKITIRQHEAYSWEVHDGEPSVGKPFKFDDDSVDSVRYLFRSLATRSPKYAMSYLTIKAA